MTSLTPAGVDPAVLGVGASRELAVVGAAATGATTLSAFHRALNAVGVGHYNLVRLSSVVPPGVLITPTHQPVALGGTWGDRLYCVFAEQRTNTPGEQVWAGVGWIQRRDGSGYLVEHEGGSEGYVHEALHKSLEDMVCALAVDAEADSDFGEPQVVVVGGHCEDRPVSALVLVTFGLESWSR